MGGCVGLTSNRKVQLTSQSVMAYQKKVLAQSNGREELPQLVKTNKTSTVFRF